MIVHSSINSILIFYCYNAEKSCFPKYKMQCQSNCQIPLSYMPKVIHISTNKNYFSDLSAATEFGLAPIL